MVGRYRERKTMNVENEHPQRMNGKEKQKNKKTMRITGVRRTMRRSREKEDERGRYEGERWPSNPAKLDLSPEAVEERRRGGGEAKRGG